MDNKKDILSDLDEDLMKSIEEEEKLKMVEEESDRNKMEEDMDEILSWVEQMQNGLKGLELENVLPTVELKADAQDSSHVADDSIDGDDTKKHDAISKAFAFKNFLSQESLKLMQIVMGGRKELRSSEALSKKDGLRSLEDMAKNNDFSALLILEVFHRHNFSLAGISSFKDVFFGKGYLNKLESASVTKDQAEIFRCRNQYYEAVNQRELNEQDGHRLVGRFATMGLSKAEKEIYFLDNNVLKSFEEAVAGKGLFPHEFCEAKFLIGISAIAGGKEFLNKEKAAKTFEDLYEIGKHLREHGNANNVNADRGAFYYQKCLEHGIGCDKDLAKSAEVEVFLSKTKTKMVDVNRMEGVVKNIASTAVANASAKGLEGVIREKSKS